MKKTFCMKLIACILAVILMVFGVLPTNVTLATEAKNQDIDIDALTMYKPSKSGWHVALESSNLVSDYAETEFIVYEENGVLMVPDSSDGKFYLEEGKTYYRVGTNPEGGAPYVITADDGTVDYYTSDEANKVSTNKDEDDSAFIERVITYFLMLVGTGFYAALCFAIGEAFSIENVIFNNYTNTRLAFFNNDVTGALNDNQFMTESNIREVLNEFFNTFTGITIVVYLIILIYMGIRILLGSTAERGSKYKELILYWLEGVLILFLFPYLMKYSIQINNAFVSFLYENKNEYLTVMNGQPVANQLDGNFENFIDAIEEIKKQLQSNSDYMSIMYQKAWNNGWLVYAVCWWVMFFQLIGFLVVYFKRVLVTMFLIAIFPLVMISYAIDKIGDAKSQAFDSWLKEFLLNVFIQSFHAITYVLIMSILSMLMEDPSENWLLMLIALTFVSKGDDILRTIFSLKGSADTVKKVGASFAKTLALTNAIKTVNNVRSNITNPNGTAMRAYNRLGQFNQKVWDGVDARASRTSAQIKLSKLEEVPTNPLNGIPLSQMATKKDLENDIRESIAILLGKKEGGATNDEVRNAADKLTGYLNQTENADVQQILDNITANLTPEERKKLDNLILQNAHINALMVGGKEINVRQNIDIILSLLQKDEYGNYTPESKAILNKIANNEDELKAMKLFGGGIKFNKDKVIEVKENKNNDKRVHNNPYFTEREIENLKRRSFRGRGKAIENKVANSESKSELEVVIKNGGKTSKVAEKTASAKRREKRKNDRARMVEQTNNGKPVERQSNGKPVERQSNGKQNYTPKNQEQLTQKTRKSVFKPVKEIKTWGNVYSVTGNEGLETAKKVTTGNVSKADNNGTNKTKNKNSFKAENMDPIRKINKYIEISPTEDKKDNTTTTNYDSKVSSKKRVFKRASSKAPISAQEANEKYQQTKEYVENIVKEEKSKNERKFVPGSGLYARMNNVANQRKLNQEDNINNTQTFNTSSSMGRSNQNAGADIANKQGSVEDLQDRMDGQKHERINLREPKFTDRDIKNGENLFNYYAYGRVRGYNEVRNRNVATHMALDNQYGNTEDNVNISEESKERLKKFGSAISILTQADGGFYTAKELLENVKYVQDFTNNHKDDLNDDEKFVLDSMTNFLDCRPEDYEAYLRVRILNDPDSVGNDRKIIEECKQYVKERPMLGVIKDRLGYNLDDLKEGQNLKYMNSRNTQYDGIISEEHRARVQEKYEKELEKYNLEKEIATLDKKIENNYSAKAYAKDGVLLAGSLAELVADLSISVGGGLATGLMSAGMTVDGKDETLSQVTTQVLAGFGVENQLYSTAKDYLSDPYDAVKGKAKNTLFKKKDSDDKDPIKELYRPRSYYDRVNELKDKTRVSNTSLFGNRGNKNKK